jgi:hypothetical protein
VVNPGCALQNGVDPGYALKKNQHAFYLFIATLAETKKTMRNTQ